MMLEQQQKIKAKIDSLATLPHSILLTGDKGAGHSEVCGYISIKYNLERIDLEEVSHEVIEDILSIKTRTLYVINTDMLDDRRQNILLKLFEEPTEYAYIILCEEGDSLLLETIRNRSYSLKMDQYQRSYLETLVHDQVNKDMILNICTTPGQIEVANHTNVNDAISLCNNMLSSMPKANFQNALHIADKINFKDEYDKFDLFFFVAAISYIAKMNGRCDVYKEISTMNKKIWYMNDKRKQFEQFLIRLWLNAHSLQTSEGRL